MPTYTVGSGKTYSTIALALAAIPSNISGTGVHEVVIDPGTYSAQISISKTGASASDYIHLRPAAGGEHLGIATAGVIVSAGSFDSVNFTISTAYTRLTNLVALQTTANNLGKCFRIAASNCLLTNCIAKCAMAGSTPYGFRFEGNNNTLVNCIAFPTGVNSVSTVGFWNQSDSFTGNKMYNCGAYGLSTGFSMSQFASATLINCWATNNTTAQFTFATGTPAAFHHCASSNSSATGTGSLTGVTADQFGFVGPSTGNFHIGAGSVLRAAGSDLSSIFTTDIDGTTITSWMIGPDFTYAAGSVVIGTDNYSMRPWPSFSITPAIQWIQDSAGYWNGSDRGAAQDAYEATAVFHGRETVINSLEQALELNRESITLSNFAAPLFAPNVDHTGSITAVVLGYTRRQLQWGAPYATHQIYELEVRFRAIAPTLLSTTPSWATLRIQDGFRAEHSHESPKAFTYAQTAVYGDHRSDTGTFEASFSQKTAELQAILAYLLVTARASAVAFPATVATTVPYPWGRARGTATNCKVLSFECSRKNLNRWALSLKLVEAP